MTDAVCDSMPTDAELTQCIKDFLANQGRSSLQRIKINVSDGVVTLTGSVGTFYEKQLCLECMARVKGLTELVDDIQVRH